MVSIQRKLWKVLQLTCSVCSLQYNKFKCRILNEKVTTPTTTVYRWACDTDVIMLMRRSGNRVFVVWCFIDEVFVLLSDLWLDVGPWLTCAEVLMSDTQERSRPWKSIRFVKNTQFNQFMFFCYLFYFLVYCIPLETSYNSQRAVFRMNYAV